MRIVGISANLPAILLWFGSFSIVERMENVLFRFGFVPKFKTCIKMFVFSQ